MGPNDTVIRYLSGAVREATEAADTAETDPVAPLKNDSLPDIIPIGDPGFLDKPLTKKAQLPPIGPPSPRRPPPHGLPPRVGTLKKSPSMQALLNGSAGQSKASLLAKQNVLIEKRKIPSKHHTKLERAAYFLDQYISTRRGQTLSLACAGLVLTLIGGCILKASQPSEHFSEMVWESWTFLGDSGSHTALTEPGLRLIGVMTSLIGILYFSVIMGFVVDGIRDKMDSLKKGKSRVAEENHTLMLGWTDKSISLIRQICLANASEKGGVVVVLAEAEKEELEAELESHLPTEELRGTKVIFRTGTPLLSVDLVKVAAHKARSIIIMATSSGDADRSDAAVLRTVLGLKTLPELTGHIVAELRDIDNEPLVRLVGGKDVEILVSHDVIGRLVLMAARSPGLARVFSCLLGFEGNEFYFKEWPECVGVPFKDLCERFPDAIPLGIKRASGDVLIFPELAMIVEPGDQIMVLAEDDDTYKTCPPTQIEVGKIPPPLPKIERIERVLMCGWRRDIRDMIKLLDCIVPSGTELHMICEEPTHLRTKLLKESGLDVDKLENLKMIHHYGNTAIRRHVASLPLQMFTSMMILADQSRETDIMNSDSHSLASLLLIRDLQAKQSMTRKAVDWIKECKCISEILDPRTQRTISTSSTILRLSEFIQSNELVSCILAMISESRDVRVILDELLGPHGSYFEVEPSGRYCTPGEQVSFWQLAKRSTALGEILCGYQAHGDIAETVLNPPDKAKPRTWENVDLIVLRSKKDNIFHNKQLKNPAPMEETATDFERTAQSRLGKSSFIRQQMLEALVQEQELANIEHVASTDQKTLSRAVQSFVEIVRHECAVSGSDTDQVLLNAKAVKSLISISRVLADTLEKYEAGGGLSGRRESDYDGEVVTAFDISSFQ
uniref:CASTOR/POLLUX/SYM8 ion channel conserved domain-containing protein n=1 Tax=Globisporangium ultimum (strain ATCC 200006 / CBS 805.95 / DAOM BR144) TaxID=431595 RepID=K3WEL4_GLOUD